MNRARMVSADNAPMQDASTPQTYPSCHVYVGKRPDVRYGNGVGQCGSCLADVRVNLAGQLQPHKPLPGPYTACPVCGVDYRIVFGVARSYTQVLCDQCAYAHNETDVLADASGEAWET